MGLIESLLAKLTASYDATSATASEVDEPIEELVIGRNWTPDMIKAARGGTAEPVKAETPRPIERQGRRETTTDNTGKPLIHGISLPKKGTLDARGFLVAMRSAGLRVSKEGAKFIDPSEVRNDSIQNIAAYCGYDSRQNYGPQELAAKSKANLELRPIKVNPNEVWRRSGTPEVRPDGYTKGIPDMVARRVAHLEGREREIIGLLCSHRREFLDSKRSLDQRAESKMMMDAYDVELSGIRADLRRFGVDREVFQG